MQQSSNRRPADVSGRYEPLMPPKVLDPTPPADHEGFLEVRELGLRAMRAHLAKRRKKK